MKKIILLVFLILFLPQTAHLQTSVEEQVSIEITPQFPSPNETVTVSVESYQTDLNKATISWYLNGELLEQGVGLKDFNFTLGDLGQENRLSVFIKKSNGDTLEKTYIINPGEVDVYYEAQTYAPPFYKGRPEFSFQSDLKLIAIPNFVDSAGNRIPDDQIVYKWKIDGDVDQKNSGTGKNVYYQQGKVIPRSIQVILEATPVNSNQLARVVKNIEPTEPSILVYEKNPIYGTIFTQNIKDDFVLDRDEIEIVAIPYDFSDDILYNGIFSWRLDGRRVDGFDQNNIIFRKTESGASKNSVAVELEHKNNLLQLTRHLFNLNFEDTNTFNF